ncbi:MAG: hypothetical protein ACMG6E_05060 [Candidatus Roizmanbacteria bacterium]
MDSFLDHKALFETVFEGVDGFSLSRAGRLKLPYFYSGHTYGEVTFDGFKAMLECTSPQPDEVFYDLGSGTGKPVVLASLLFDFSKVIGIELLEELYDGSMKMVERYKYELLKYSELASKKHEIRFIHSDYGQVDFSDADVIFINATCAEYDMTPPLLEKFESLKTGTRILTSTIYISSEAFDIKDEGEFPFTWGKERVYLHVKK